MSGRAIEQGRERSLAALTRETGGIIIGWYEARTIYVDQLLEVADLSAGRTHYQRNNQAAAEILKVVRSKSAKFGYVGEWHTHPAAIGPSLTDRTSLRVLAREATLPIALVVISARSEGRPIVHSRVGSTFSSRRNLARLIVGGTYG